MTTVVTSDPLGHLRRFYLLLGALGAVNLLTALAITLWLPSTVVSGPAAPATLMFLQQQPMVSIPRNRDRGLYEQRIRALIHDEFQNIGLAVPSQTESTRQVGLIAGRSGLQTDTAGGLRVQPEAAPRTERPIVQGREVNAMLTPFGVYRAGPAGLLMVGVALAAALSAAVAMLYLAPARLSRVRDLLTVSVRHNLRLGAMGVMGYLLACSLLFVLVAVVTGILFAALLAMLLTGATFLGLIGLALALGRWLRNRLAPGAPSPLADLVLGILVIFPLGLVPWAGWLFALGLSALGFGALLASRFGSEEAWSLEPLHRGESYGIRPS